MKPTISVIMSVYQEPIQWIIESVDSILGQTFSNFEFIIVIDNPAYNEAKKYLYDKQKQDKRILIMENDCNIGLTKSLNIALTRANGIFIARMDADDIALKNRFQEQVKFLENHQDVAVCATNTNIINQRGEIIRVNNYRYMHDASWLILDNPIAHSTVMFRHELTKLRNPLYNENFRSSQDFELWSFLLLHDVKIHIIKCPLLLYRKSLNQISSLHKEKQLKNSIISHKNLLTKFLWKFNVGEVPHSDIKQVLQNCKKKLTTANPFEKLIIEKIIYLLYLNLSVQTIRYSLKYLTDRNLFFFKFPFRLSLHIVLAFHYRSKLSKYLFINNN